MFFSIVIPIFNVEKYLEECVGSILKQSFSDYEIILVDDGSTDNSPQICDRLSELDSRIRVIHKPNGGQADARNKGTQLASGEYLIYIDSDDFISDPEFLSDIFELCKKNDIVCYKFQKFFESTDRLQPCGFSMPVFAENTDISEKIRLLSANDAMYCAAWTKAIRRSLITENNICFETGCKCEDMKWYFEVLLKAESIAGIDKSYIVYRQREGSVTKTNDLKTIADNVASIEDIYSVIESEAKSSEVKKALLCALSKLYCNLLINYASVDNKAKKEYYARIKAMSELLNYHENRRSDAFFKIYKLFGFGGLILMLSVLCKLRHND